MSIRPPFTTFGIFIQSISQFKFKNEKISNLLYTETKGLVFCSRPETEFPLVHNFSCSIQSMEVFFGGRGIRKNVKFLKISAGVI